MASHNEPQTAQQVAAPIPYAPPSVRELRRYSVHRLQIGLIGLAAMLLLVALANVIMDRARMADGAQDSTQAQGSEKQKSTDPLADIGVVPAAPAKDALSEIGVEPPVTGKGAQGDR